MDVQASVLRTRGRQALRDAIRGLLAGLIVIGTHALYRAYVHLDRDLWGIPLLSRDNQVDGRILAAMIFILLPLGMLCATALLATSR